jgi:hypothetical protein
MGTTVFAFPKHDWCCPCFSTFCEIITFTKAYQRPLGACIHTRVIDHSLSLWGGLNEKGCSNVTGCMPVARHTLLIRFDVLIGLAWFRQKVRCKHRSTKLLDSPIQLFFDPAPKSWPVATGAASYRTDWELREFVEMSHLTHVSFLINEKKTLDQGKG